MMDPEYAKKLKFEVKSSAKYFGEPNEDDFRGGEGTQQCCASKSDGKRRCRNVAVKGAVVCHKHGAAKGMPGRALADARTNVFDRRELKVAGKEWSKGKMTEEIRRWHRIAKVRGDSRHPIEHLLDELYLSANIVAVLGEIVSHREDLTQWGETGREEHILYKMWTEERERHAKLAAMALKAGIEERQVQLREDQANLMAGAIRNILEDLGVADHPEAPRIVRKHLMSISRQADEEAERARKLLAGDIEDLEEEGVIDAEVVDVPGERI